MCVAWLMVPLRSLTSPASCPPWPPWFSFPSPTPISLKSRVTRGREKLPCAASLPTRLPWLGLVQARARSSVAVSPVDGKDPGTQAICPGASAGSWFRSITSGTPCSSHLGTPMLQAAAAPPSVPHCQSHPICPQEQLGAGQGWSQEPGAPCGSPTWRSGVQFLGPLPAAFPGTGSCVGSGAAGLQPVST